MKHIYLLFIAMSFAVLGQDLHLTQYYTSNTSLNPALTGNYEGDFKFVANYRSQWSQVLKPIKTSMFSVEKKFPKYNGDEWAGGLLLGDDQVSALFLQSNRVLLSGSYLKKLNGHSLRFGLQAGVVNRRINMKDQSFPDQWDYASGIYNPSIFNGESSLQNSSLYLDVNAGVAWSKLVKKTRITAGYAIYHANRPKDNFVSNKKAVAFRHVINGTAKFNLKSGFSISPNLLLMYSAAANDIVLGANAGKKLNEDFSLLLGAGFRTNSINKDAALVILGLGYKQIDFGISFDYNMSQLSKTMKQKNAWEISLAYTTPSIVPHKITIPCDRY